MRQLPLNLSQVWLVQCKPHKYRQFSPYEFKHAFKKWQSLFTNIFKVKKIYETKFSASENLKCLFLGFYFYNKALNEKNAVVVTRCTIWAHPPRLTSGTPISVSACLTVQRAWQGTFFAVIIPVTSYNRRLYVKRYV